MPELSYQITADDSQAVAASSRVEKSFDKIEESGKRAFTSIATGFSNLTASIVSVSRQAEQAFGSMARAAGSFTDFVVKGTAAILALASAHAVLTNEVLKYTTAAVRGSSATETLVNVYRGA